MSTLQYPRMLSLFPRSTMVQTKYVLCIPLRLLIVGSYGNRIVNKSPWGCIMKIDLLRASIPAVIIAPQPVPVFPFPFHGPLNPARR